MGHTGLPPGLYANGANIAMALLTDPQAPCQPLPTMDGPQWWQHLALPITQHMRCWFLPAPVREAVCIHYGPHVAGLLLKGKKKKREHQQKGTFTGTLSG